ncbi:MAG TPA: dephospho-CoA kinase [Alkalispirochaeta sp.]|nr:dephospho-CoA kinase [Alkalispirochaeta sp.]
MSSPQVIGVAGKCCAGKDLVTGWLLEHGRREINVDRIGHEALAAEHARIVATFGREIVDERGTIDRRALGNIVFADQNQRHRLESIVHPWMRERVRREIAEWRGEQGLVINAALLFYMELDSLCDAVLLVRAPLRQRFQRARRRDDLSLRHILRRLWIQRGLDAQALSSPAETITVENGRTPEVLFQRLSELPQLQ